MKKLKLNRKNYILFILIFIITEGVCLGQSIEYIPIGPIDKPFPTFFFSYKNKVLRKKHYEFFVFEHKYKLSREKFDSLYKEINASLVKTNAVNAKDSLSDNYGSYKVVVKIGNRIEVFILNNKELSNQFFENQLIFFKDEPTVTEVILDSLMKRLK